MKSNNAQPVYNGIRDVLRSVYKEGGMRALYRGVGMYMLALLCSLLHSASSAIYLAKRMF